MILLLMVANLWAGEVVIQAEQTPEIVYERYLSENPKSQSFIQYFLSRKPDLSHRLFSDLKSAQFYFLSGDMEQSQKHFRKMAELQHRANWTAKERKSIHYALMRLFQMERDKNKKSDWLRQAIAFDYEKRPDPKLFPPPVVESYENLRAKMPQSVWPLPEKADLFDKILINGKTRKVHSGFIRTVGEVQRIQFLSNKYSPVHYVTEPKELKKLSIKLTPLARGNCHGAVLSSHFKMTRKWVYVLNDCLSGQGLKGFVGRKNYSGLRSGQETLDLPKDRSFGELQPIGEKKSAFYQSKWFWIGLSALVTGFTFHELQNNKRSPAKPQQEVSVFTNNKGGG